MAGESIGESEAESEAIPPGLYLKFCSYNFAKAAVENWHYSHSMPTCVAALGVWENKNFVGALVFNYSACAQLGSPYGLTMRQTMELSRVALKRHDAPVSRILAIARKLLKRRFPVVRLLVSFADRGEGHHGGIYKADGWIYTGSFNGTGKYFIVHGKRYHGRTLGGRYGKGGQSLEWLKKNVDPNVQKPLMLDKYRYVYPLDQEIRAKVEAMRVPDAPEAE